VGRSRLQAMLAQRTARSRSAPGFARLQLGYSCPMPDARNTAPLILDNREKNRFETETTAGTAVLQYTRSGDRIVLLHTEVPRGARERGVGGRLVEAAFQQARERGSRVVPVCPFVRAYLRRHPELRSLVEEK